MHTAKRRAKPGSSGQGRFFHIELRPRSSFNRFRVHDVGDPGGLKRVAGRRDNGSWDTVKWLVEKKEAQVHGGRLIPRSTDARKLFRTLGSVAVQITGDRFQAKPRVKIPKSDKPTARQRRTRQRNSRKAPTAR